MKQDTYNIDVNDYEFFDFGCSAGASLKRYEKIFKCEGKGLGLDINPAKVAATLEQGYDAVECDITKIEISSKIRFSIMHHFLEHVPSLYDVAKIINKACEVSNDFVLIRQPYFEADAQLFEKGFKLYWSNWSGHPNHMTFLEFHNILYPLFRSGKIKNFSAYGLYPIENSDDPSVHNIDSIIDQHFWEEGKHSSKQLANFDFPIFKESMVVIDISGDWVKKIEAIFKPPKMFFSTTSSDLGGEGRGGEGR